MPTVSLVMIVKNEERCLSRCLESAKPLVDEIVIVDTGSTDASADIARSFGARVLRFEWRDDFSAARNFGIDHSTSDWILSLDADEYFDRDYRKPLARFLLRDPVIGRINIQSRFVRDEQEYTAQADISRLFPHYVRYKGIIHEQLDSSLPRVDSGLSLLHDGYLLDKSNRNMRLLTQSLSIDPDNAYLWFQLAKEYRGLNQFEEAERYYEKACRSLPLSAGYAVELLVDYLYILLKNRRLEEALEVTFAEFDRLRFVPDFHFVRAHILMEVAIADPSLAIDILPQIELAYVECLRLGQQRAKEIVVGTSSFLAEYNLAVFYELNNQPQLAKKYYTEAARHGYSRALERLSLI